jgi:hypothetical protein
MADEGDTGVDASEQNTELALAEKAFFDPA